MIKHSFPGEIVIYPIADVHYGAVEHNEQGWRRLLDEILAQDNAYVILNGDLVNNAVKSSVSNVYRETAMPRAQKDYMVETLRPLTEKGRILAITSGNHERRTSRESDQDITYDIACRLGIEHLYRENIAFLSISIGERDRFGLVVTHGAGGGIYTGATVNRNERFAQVIDGGMDCLIVGHTHKGTVSRPSKLVINLRNGTVVQKEYVVLSCVSWMSYGGYAMQKMLLPSTDSQPQKLVLRPATNQHTRNKKIEVIW